MQFNQIESASFKSIQNQGIRKPGSANPSSIKTAISPSMELQVGRTLGAAEISTGINFQRIQYSPDVLLTSGTLASFTETYVEEISYDFVSIPLEVNLAVYEKQNWRLRLHGGLLTSFLINAKERISQKIIRGNRTIEVEADAVDRSVFNYAFEDGFLSSDTVQSSKPSLLQTMRYKANLGLSLSKRLNRSTELFGRTDVFYQIPLTTGELNNIDLINTLSFSIGVKKYLG